MKHIIFYSGGLGSWATARRVIEREGVENVICMFTDTLIEDEDLYRFILESTQQMYGIDQLYLIKRVREMPLVRHKTMEERKLFLAKLAEDTRSRNPNFIWINDGRDPWDVFKDVRFLGNSRQANCSHELKQKMSARYIEKNFKPHEPSYIKKIDKRTKEITYYQDRQDIERINKEWEEDERIPCKLYLGIDWTEQHRTKAPRYNWLPYKVEFPMCEEPLVTKIDVVKELEESGIPQPKLYDMGFSHNNCGGFCVRAGQGHFVNLLENKPQLYKYHEEREQEIREFLEKDVSILRRQRKGERFRLTLEDLRKEIEDGNTSEIDMNDIGGCGCFVDID